ncbi:MAG: hypothetical protein U9O85_01265 [Euryarchaeota archaeon]|nr:hypothetical protein [Euryarchaeota archaeon]
MIEIGYLIAVISAIGAIGAALVTYYLYTITKRNLVYQVLVKLQIEYRSPEMLYAIRTLWDFYRDDCNEDEETLMEKYGEKYDEEKRTLQKMRGKPEEKNMEFVKTTLHHQRRLVQMFYEHLATLTTNDIIPKKIVFEIWTEEMLSIVPKIILPMAKKLAEKTDTNPPDENSKLYQLYIDSKDYV